MSKEMQMLLLKQRPVLFDALWLALALCIVTALHTATLAIDPDDKSFYRAASFITTYAHSPLTDSIKTRLKDQGFGNPIERLAFSKYYFANNFLVEKFERLPLFSPFQSVYLANLV
jgi:hypothetical protein